MKLPYACAALVALASSAQAGDARLNDCLKMSKEVSAALEKAQSELSAAEERWLELEMLREELGL